MAKKKETLTIEEKLQNALVPDWEQPYKLPENWCWTRVDSVCKLSNGNKSVNKQLPYLEAKYLRGKINAVIKEKGNYIGSGSKVILVDGENSGEVFHIYENGYMGSTFRLLEISGYINYDIFEYFLSTHKDEFRNSKTGSAIPHLNKELFKNKPFPLPPLAEQKRIVEQIEILFSKLDDAKELAQSALDSFENRKSAILHKAFTGELTKKWREENGVSFDSWSEKTFEKFCYLNRGFDLPATKRTKGEYSLVTSSGITDTHNEYKIKAPGVVTGRSGTIGKVFYIENDYWPLNTTLYAKKMYDNYPRYVYYHLTSFDFKKYSSSTAVPTLNRNNFSDELVRIPTLLEQKEIVRILDSFFPKEAEAKELVSVIDKIDLIKKSILSKAFRGKLGTNDVNEESSVGLLREILEGK